MDANGLPLFGPQIDYSKVESLERKWIIGHFNNFLLQSVHLLNTFSATCESKLYSLNQRLQNVEAALTILETKLASIPGLDSVPCCPPSSTPPPPVQAPPPPPIPVSNVPAQATQATPPPTRPQEQEESAVTQAARDPRLARYYKMIQVGVPLPAVKIKMQSEGLDPNLLDSPSPGVPSIPTNGSASGSDSSSLYSHDSSNYE